MSQDGSGGSRALVALAAAGRPPRYARPLAAFLAQLGVDAAARPVRAIGTREAVRRYAEADSRQPLARGSGARV